MTVSDSVSKSLPVTGTVPAEGVPAELLSGKEYQGTVQLSESGVKTVLVQGQSHEAEWAESLPEGQQVRVRPVRTEGAVKLELVEVLQPQEASLEDSILLKISLTRDDISFLKSYLNSAESGIKLSAAGSELLSDLNQNPVELTKLLAEKVAAFQDTTGTAVLNSRVELLDKLGELALPVIVKALESTLAELQPELNLSQTGTSPVQRLAEVLTGMSKEISSSGKAMEEFQKALMGFIREHVSGFSADSAMMQESLGQVTGPELQRILKSFEKVAGLETEFLELFAKISKGLQGELTGQASSFYSRFSSLREGGASYQEFFKLLESTDFQDFTNQAAKQLSTASPQQGADLKLLIEISEELQSIGGEGQRFSGPKAVLYNVLTLQSLPEHSSSENPLPGQPSVFQEEPFKQAVKGAVNMLRELIFSGLPLEEPDTRALSSVFSRITETLSTKAEVPVQELIKDFEALGAALKNFTATQLTAQESEPYIPMVSTLIREQVAEVLNMLKGMTDLPTSLNFQNLFKGSADSPLTNLLNLDFKQLSALLDPTVLANSTAEHEAALLFADTIRTLSDGQSDSYIRQRDRLQGLVDRIKSSKVYQKPGSREEKGLDDIVRTVENMNSALRGQEVLSTLNSVFNSASEGVFIMFPALMQGFLQNVEMSFYRELEEKEKKKGEKDFKRVDVVLEFQSLGKVSSSIIHAKPQILIEMETVDDETAVFLKNMLPELRKRLTALGYSQSDFSFEKAKGKSFRPYWVDTVTTGSDFKA